MKFDVFLPSLLVSPDWFADSRPPRLPAIEALLAHGVSRVGAEWPNVLLPAFGVSDMDHSDHSHPLAAVTAHGDNIVTGSYGWMFAEPAHFQADRDTINLFPSSHLDITTGEAAQLIDALNANFEDRGLTFSRGGSGHWYVCCDAQELPQTTSIRAAQRGAVFEKLPKSNGKLLWKAIQNEAQMLLHSHAVNEQREAIGKLTINGLWFWGEGVLPKIPIGRESIVGAVFGDIALPNGLARLSGARFAQLNQLNIFTPKSLANHNLVVLDALEFFHERGDIEGWREAALKLDSQIFVTLLASLRTGVIDDVILTLPRDRDSLVVAITAQSQRGISGWWKKLSKNPRPFLESAVA